MSTPALHPALEFETPRLIGRWLAPEDESAYVWLYTDPETMRFVGPSLSAERAASNFRRALASNRNGVPKPLYLALVEKASDSPVGVCSLHRLDLDRRAADTGIILHASRRGRGYAKEAVDALVTRTFASLPLHEIGAEFCADHSIAERVLIGLGFVPSEAAAPLGTAARRIRRVRLASWVWTQRAIEKGERA